MKILFPSYPNFNNTINNKKNTPVNFGNKTLQNHGTLKHECTQKTEQNKISFWTKVLNYLRPRKTPYQIETEELKKKLFNNEFISHYGALIIWNCLNSENKQALSLILESEKHIQDFEIKLILKATNKNNKNLLPIFLKELPDDHLESIFNFMHMVDTHKKANYFKNANINKSIKNVLNAQKLVLKTPELYINDTNASKEYMEDEINKFFHWEMPSLTLFATIYDKESLHVLLQKRLFDASEYLDTLKNFSAREWKLLSKMQNIKTIDGKDFSSAEKIDFINLIFSYSANNMDLTEIERMVQSGNIDIELLNKNLLKNIFRKIKFNDNLINSILKEKIKTWDLKKIHLLALELNERENYSYNNLGVHSVIDANILEILQAEIFENNFIDYIQKDNTACWKYNKENKKMFNSYNLNYEKWILPDKSLEINFKEKDRNTEKLTQISNQIIEDINFLREGREKFIDKQIRQFIKNGKFIIPKSALTSASQLEKFTQTLIKQLEPIWTLAKENKNNDDKNIKIKAKNTLTILEHLNQHSNNISEINDEKQTTQNINWTIKMWDRNPRKDLFQGNYSTCCIGMGSGNGSATFQYLLNTAFNMIEFVDNLSGKTIGNALCYFALDKNNKPALVIDNIEINNSQKLSKETGKKLLQSITEYATKIAKDITGKNNTNIYLGTSFNDIPTEHIIEETKQLRPIVTSDEEIYMDVFDGWIDTKSLPEEIKVFRLK